MGCNACHSSCGDCSERSITFKRVVRSPAQDTPPATWTVAKEEQSLLFIERQAEVQQEQRAEK
jgi:hypothetical protein